MDIHHTAILPGRAYKFALTYIVLMGLIGAILSGVVITLVDTDLRNDTIHRIETEIASSSFHKTITTSLSEASVRLNQIVGIPGFATVQHNVGARPTEISRNWVYDSKGLSSYRYLDLDGDPAFYKVTLHWRSTWSHVTAKMVSILITAFLIFTALLVVIASRHFQSNFVDPIALDLRNIEEQLLLAEGVQMAAHDLRKPLFMTRHYISQQANQRKTKKNSELSETDLSIVNIENKVVGAVTHAESIIRDLLSMGRSSPSQNIEISLYDLLDNALMLVAQDSNTSSVVFEWNLRHGQMLTGEPSLIGRVLSNLLSNGVEATGSNGRVWVHSRDVQIELKSWVQIRIGNSGTHIPSERIATLFKPFSTHGKRGGTGLGLAIVKKFINMHGGGIAVESDLETGTEFVITLPGSAALDRRIKQFPAKLTVTEKKSTKKQPDFTPVTREGIQAEDTKTGLHKVILIEDDPFIHDMWNNTKSGLTVEHFLSPEDLIAKLHNSSLDANTLCIITDYHFGNSDLSGHDLAEAVAKYYSGPIFVSSAIFDALPNHPNVSSHLEKRPYSAEELLNLIKKLEAVNRNLVS